MAHGCEYHQTEVTKRTVHSPWYQPRHNRKPEAEIAVSGNSSILSASVTSNEEKIDLAAVFADSNKYLYSVGSKVKFPD